MLLGNTDIVESLRVGGLERQQTGGARHSCSDGVHIGAFGGDLQQRISECRRPVLGLGGERPGDWIEDLHVVQILLVVVLGERVALALVGEHMDHNGPVVGGGVTQRLFEQHNVVAIYGSYVANAECLKEGVGLTHDFS